MRSTVWVGRVKSNCPPHLLEDAFRDVARVVKVETGFAGFAFVEMETEDDADKAVERLNKKMVPGVGEIRTSKATIRGYQDACSKRDAYWRSRGYKDGGTKPWLSEPTHAGGRRRSRSNSRRLERRSPSVRRRPRSGSAGRSPSRRRSRSWSKSQRSRSRRQRSYNRSNSSGSPSLRRSPQPDRGAVQPASPRRSRERSRSRRSPSQASRPCARSRSRQQDPGDGASERSRRSPSREMSRERGPPIGLRQLPSKTPPPPPPVPPQDGRGAARGQAKSKAEPGSSQRRPGAAPKPIGSAPDPPPEPRSPSPGSQQGAEAKARATRPPLRAPLRNPAAERKGDPPAREAPAKEAAAKPKPSVAPDDEPSEEDIGGVLSPEERRSVVAFFDGTTAPELLLEGSAVVRVPDFFVPFLLKGFPHGFQTLGQDGAMKLLEVIGGFTQAKVNDDAASPTAGEERTAEVRQALVVAADGRRLVRKCLVVNGEVVSTEEQPL